MKISALVWDLSDNSIVRTYPIVKVLERHHEVQVIGPVLGDGIFGPYERELNYLPAYIEGHSLRKLRHVLTALLNAITGDLIYAFKPLPTSYGIALLSQLKKRRPIILDIEDWENEAFEALTLSGKITHAVRNFYHMNGFYKWIVDSLHVIANDKTVVSNFLQQKYGGVRLPHGADNQSFNPLNYDRKSLRTSYGVDQKKVIVFAGTVRAHKGLDLLLEAVQKLKSKDIVILIAGEAGPGLEQLVTDTSIVRYLGQQPHSKMPELWLLADLVVLPQRDTRFAQAQIPGKVFEAMAMARPIIASTVSDLPEILGGVGWLTPPGDLLALAENVEAVFSNPKKAEERGEAARRRYLERYSWDVMDDILSNLISKY